MEVRSRKGRLWWIDVRNGRKFKFGRNVPQKYKERLRSLCTKYENFISWTYDDLKGYDSSIIQHTIDLVEGFKPIWQKKMPVNPKIEALMVQELTILINSRIIYLIKNSTWVSNFIPVWKKNGDILLCMDFWDLNKASLKDHYPLLWMEKIL